MNYWCLNQAMTAVLAVALLVKVPDICVQVGVEYGYAVPAQATKQDLAKVRVQIAIPALVDKRIRACWVALGRTLKS